MLQICVTKSAMLFTSALACISRKDRAGNYANRPALAFPFRAMRTSFFRPASSDKWKVPFRLQDNLFLFNVTDSLQ